MDTVQDSANKVDTNDITNEDENKELIKEADKFVLQKENDDLRTATSQNDNIVMELGLNGRVQFLSKCWEDIVGYAIKLKRKKKVANIFL